MGVAGRRTRPERHRQHNVMKKLRFSLAPTLFAAAFLGAALVLPARAEDDDPIAKFMKATHGAPKGVDSVSKKAVKGIASPAEIQKLIAGYKMMAKQKPEKGDLASWKEKTAALIKTSEALVNGDEAARKAYEQAVNCKACHSQHKPDKEH